MTDDEITTLAADLRALRERWGEDTARAALAGNATLTADQRTRVEALVFLGGAQVGEMRIDAVAGQDVVKGTKGAVDNSGTLHGAAVGVNQGTVQLFFGARPPNDAKTLLDNYLRGLIADHGYLRLGKLLDRERSGRDQAVMPEIALLKVYTSLATDALLPAGPFELAADALGKAMDAASPDDQLPEQVRMPVLDMRERGAPAAPPHHAPRSLGDLPMSEAWRAARRELRDGHTALSGQWYRPEILITAIQGSPRLVLLGSPGSGKSTGLRHLTVFIATALLSGTKTLRIPFFCPLGPVAQELTDDPRQDLDTLVAALLRPALGAGNMRAGLREQIQAAITSGNAFLFFDGLDEVPGTPEPTRTGLRSRRERVADAIRALARQVGAARVVVSCRTRPYEQDAAWQLREGWAVRRLQPFAFGQVRAYVTKWYAATTAEGQGRYTPAEAVSRAKRLITLLEHPDRAILRELAASPLLLTMLVLLDYNNTRMPERRADVYEELVKLLLDRWEGVRSSETDRRPQRLGERLGFPHLTVEELRPALHELAFAAHRQLVDGRGVLTGPLLRETLELFFARKLNAAQPNAARAEAARPREIFMGLLLEESGLLLEEDDETYVLPHLTFEEYLAACYLAGRDGKGIEQAYAQWRDGGERWREVARLLMGRLLRQEKYDNLFAWLQLLVAPRCGGQAKAALQCQRDALLAADCYAEMEGRAAFTNTLHDLVRFEDDLRAALVALLDCPDPALALPERVEAAEALAALGDPRYPTTDDAWRAELGRRSERFGQPASYWRYVPGGRYQIGGWPDDEREEGLVDRIKGAARRMMSRGTEIALQPFWVARYPLTVAQYTPFVTEGYGPDAERWWTPEGWKWKQQNGRTEPWFWGDPTYSSANQPVISLTWYEATAYCAWLTERLRDSLPEGYAVCLPTEAEWEAAAAYDAHMQRRNFPWEGKELTPDLAIYQESQVGRPAPVGCCPAGMAASGVLDIVGNVWEWTASSYKGYPAQAGMVTKDFTSDQGDVPIRGGSWRNNRTSVRCGARGGDRPVDGVLFIDRGLRVCVSPRSHKDSVS